MMDLLVPARSTARGQTARPGGAASGSAEVLPGLLGPPRDEVGRARRGPVDGDQSKQHSERRSKVGATAREARLTTIDVGPVGSSGSRD
jgi:hypothetical protein